jgi:hypothetical protein
MSRLSELQKQFQYHFDDCSGDIMIAGITFSPSDILKELDPIAYNQEFFNYCDYMDIDLDSEVEYV